jgi:hypothetical protein
MDITFTVQQTRLEETAEFSALNYTAVSQDCVKKMLADLIIAFSFRKVITEINII